MKKWFAKYSRPCRAAIMLLLVYSSHLFSFHSLLASPGYFLTSVLKSKKAKGAPHRHTDCLLLLSKHELVKQKQEGPGDKLLTRDMVYDHTEFHYPVETFFNNTPQSLSNASYKRYRLLSTFLI